MIMGSTLTVDKHVLDAGSRLCLSLFNQCGSECPDPLCSARKEFPLIRIYQLNVLLFGQCELDEGDPYNPDRITKQEFASFKAGFPVMALHSAMILLMMSSIERFWHWFICASILISHVL
jgi:hypothetical protein